MVATVHGEWNNASGPRTGSYAIYLPVRLTDPAGNLIYPAGLYASGRLVAGELSVTVPASDDDDISPQDWQLQVVVSFAAGEEERYAIPVPDGTTIELADVVLPQELGEPEPVLIRGIAGGIAELDHNATVPLDQLPVLPAFQSVFGVVNVKATPYSATGNGVTNDRTAIVAALTAATADGLTVHFPGGDYLITSGITVPAGVKVTGDPGARIFGNIEGDLVTVNSNVVLDGITIQNNGQTGSDVAVAASSTHVRIHRVTLLSENAFVGSAIGVTVDKAGCSDIGIFETQFGPGIGYGFLSNVAGNTTGAWNLRDVTIADCHFNVRADAIEFNHPNSAATVAGGFIVTGNQITVPDFVVDAPSAGFGIGLANVRDCLIADNRLENIRNQGIHIEDDCANILVQGNLVKNVDGTLASFPASQNVGISVAKSTNVTITDNHVEDCRGSGFEMIFDGSTVNDHITITNNSVTDCDEGFSMYGGPGGGHIICSHNRAYGNSGNGFQVGGQAGIQLTNNLSFDNDGWGIFRPSGDGATYLGNFRDNFLYGNTLGDINGQAISGGGATMLHDKSTFIEGTTAVDGYHLPAAFRLGAWARGTVRLFMQTASGHRADVTQDVTWDGTTFATVTVRGAVHGSADVKCRSMVDGSMVLEVYSLFSQAYRVSVRFDGLIIETSQTFSGTVMASALGPMVRTTDTQTLTNKRVTPRTGTTTSSATPTINTDNVDFYSLTAQAADITSMTSGLSGTPTAGQGLWISIKGTAARAITWGASFEGSTVALPTTTVSTDQLDVEFVWNAATSKWRCVRSC